jgi:hypothetical protein
MRLLFSHPFGQLTVTCGFVSLHFDVWYNRGAGIKPRRRAVAHAWVFSTLSADIAGSADIAVAHFIAA